MVTKIILSVEVDGVVTESREVVLGDPERLERAINRNTAGSAKKEDRRNIGAWAAEVLDEQCGNECVRMRREDFQRQNLAGLEHLPDAEIELIKALREKQ